MANEEFSLPLAQTPLFQLAVELKARLTSFGGWEMPVQFAGISSEHQAVRTAAGMFDISHMGKFACQGQGLIAQFQRLVPSDLSRLQRGKSQYTVLLNPQGGIIDDIIFYYQGEDATGQQRAIIIVNAATNAKDKAWLLSQLDPSLAQLKELPPQVLIAIQGPKAATCLQQFVKEDLTPIAAFGHLNATILEQPGFVARTGYTGEDGFEIMVEPTVGIQLWHNLFQAGVIPCGLGARDTLRLEASMALYGQDIDDTTTPLEAGLGWLVHLDTKGDFIGRGVLEQQKLAGVPRKLVGLQMQGRNIARHGYQVLSSDCIIGEITSGTISPTLGYPVALAYVPTELAKIGQILEVEIRGKTYPALVVKKPFYKKAY